MTNQQVLKLAALQETTPHSLSVLVSATTGNFMVHFPFPGLYVTIDPNGELIETFTQYEYVHGKAATVPKPVPPAPVQERLPHV